MSTTILNHRLSNKNVPVKVERKTDLTNEEILQYSGQMTDGDGYIGAYYDTGNNNNIYIRDEICILTSTSKNSLMEIDQRIKQLGYETVVYFQKGKGNARDLWRLSIKGSRKNKIKLLEELRPHLINKHRQAEALEQIYNNIDIEFNMELLKLLNKKGVNHDITEEQKLAIEKWIGNEQKNKKKRPTKIPNKICKKPAAVAGCMDSDGDISMIKNKDGYILYVIINLSAKEFYTHNIINNLLYSDEYVYINDIGYNTEKSKHLYPNCKPTRWIRLSTNKKNIFIRQFLYEVAPYMIIRFEQAKTAIDYIEGRISDEECYRILTDLNKRGKEAWGETTLLEKIKETNVVKNVKNMNVYGDVVVNSVIINKRPSKKKKSVVNQHQQLETYFN